MSDLSNLLSQLAKVAATDYGKAVAPVLSQSATQLATTPAAAPAIGVAVLGSLGTAGVQIPADEVSALVTWTNAEVASSPPRSRPRKWTTPSRPCCCA